MNRYWAFVKTGTGGFVKVYVTAENIWIAGQILKNTYGDNLQSGASLAS